MNNKSATLVHFSRGRIRLRAEGLRKRRDSDFTFVEKLESLSAIERVELKPRTGSVLILYNPSGMERAEAVITFLEHLTSIFSPIRIGKICVWHIESDYARCETSLQKSIATLNQLRDSLLRIKGVTDVDIDHHSGLIDVHYNYTILAQHVRTLHDHMPVNRWRSLGKLFVE